MCDKPVDAFLPTLNFVPDWFVTSKMLEQLDNVLFSNDIKLDDLDTDILTFFSDDMDNNTIDPHLLCYLNLIYYFISQMNESMNSSILLLKSKVE